MWRVKITYSGPFKSYSDFDNLDDVFEYLEMQDYYSISEVMIERFGDVS